MSVSICPRHLQTSSLSGHYEEKVGSGLVKIAQVVRINPGSNLALPPRPITSNKIIGEPIRGGQ